MLGVNSNKKMTRPPCPFQAVGGPCGKDTRFSDDTHTMVRCREGHLSSVSSLPAGSAPQEPRVNFKPFRLSFNPRSAALFTTLLALSADAVSRHL